MTTSRARIAVLAALALPAFAVSAMAQTPPAPPPASEAARELGTIAVTGEGEAAIAPDMAVITLTVLREAETAREALDASNEAMDAVLAAMKAEGVAERDLQTSGFGVSPQYVYPQNASEPQEPRITGYQVANTLSVRLRDLDKLGAVLDQSVTLGVNQGGDIQFTNDDPTAVLAEARRDAVADAKAKAETLTEAAGVRLGRVLRIDETIQRAQPIPMARAEMAKSFAADASVPIANGENTYRVFVNMSWELAE